MYGLDYRCVLFFKQKTAYDVRISEGSACVCSSDLPARVAFGGFSAGGQVATSLLTRFDAKVYAPVDAADALPARPDALAAVYPVVSMDPAIAHAMSREKLIGADADAARENAYSPERNVRRSAEHTSELQSLMRISY